MSHGIGPIPNEKETTIACNDLKELKAKTIKLNASRKFQYITKTNLPLLQLLTRYSAYCTCLNRETQIPKQEMLKTQNVKYWVFCRRLKKMVIREVRTYKVP